MNLRTPALALLAGACLLVPASGPRAATLQDPVRVVEGLDGRIHAGGRAFDSWREYAASEFFELQGKRCGVPRDIDRKSDKAVQGGSAADCTLDSTNPSAAYDPAVVRYRIPVVVHVIQNTSGSGFLTEAQVESQIDILNEDFLALAGSNGQHGTDVQLEFFLATEDPDGNPSNGITYTTNNTWFNDGGFYWNTLAWDTHRYLNIYTNTAGGNLGYVPSLPQGGIVGSPQDRVVVLWSSFGRDGAIGPPFDQGRTATHEVGHYLGLDHTFGGGCGSASACYTTGDLLCDTSQQSTPTSGCTDAATCGNPDPIHNYMDYSFDLCMEEFTLEQARRMRCSLEGYRPDLLQPADTECGNAVLEFGEECDDGNITSLDGCDADCRIEIGCGNGRVEAGEECDDGNTTDGDGCDAACQLEPVCGNGVVEEGEACDDGNTAIGDGCDAVCLLEPVCGNGIVEAGEDCEPPSTASCDAACHRIPLCGDGTTDPGEECDDGNAYDLDGCDAACRIEIVPSDCCLTGHGSGCSVPEIQTCVCSSDAFCCVFDWDEVCVGLVEDEGCGSCTVEAPAEVSRPGAIEPLLFTSRDTLLWEDPDESGAVTFNLYLGESSAVALGDYGSCLQSGIGEPAATHTDSPPSGTIWTYLVTGSNPAGEGPLGVQSTGSPRPNADACPDLDRR